MNTTNTAGQPISLTFQGRCPPDFNPVLNNIASAIESQAEQQGWDMGTMYKVNLALEEVAINIISYGGQQGGPSPNIWVNITPTHQEISIQVSDDGKPFNPLTDAPPPPVIDEASRFAPVGGFGLHLVKNMMESVTYQHSQGRNHLTMTARRDEA